MKHLILSAIICTCSTALHAGIVVTGNDKTGTPKAFSTEITAEVYDRKTGTLFVGLAAGTTDSAYQISKATRPNFATVPSFTGILAVGGTTSSLAMSTIEFLVFSQPPTGLGILTTVAKETNAFEATSVTSLYTNDTPVPEINSGNLNDASGSATTSGICGLAANNDRIFAAVQPNGNTFGDPNSGIALLGVSPNGTSNITLATKDATTGNAGNKAAALNAASAVLKGTSGGDDVVFNSNAVIMYWDDVLQRLFISLQITSGTNPTDIAKGVTVARLVSDVVTFEAIAPDSAISGGSVDEIVVAMGSDVPLSPRNMGVMHASTGPDYLIVDCVLTTKRVFALPLVNNTSNISDSLNGTIASKGSSLDSTTKKFTTAATSPGELPENDPIADPAAVVGAGNLPIETATSISALRVIGDAVYVSLAQSPNAANDSGIWVSQAMFDNTGKIQRWTPWTAKRVIPLNAFPGIMLPGGGTHSGSISFFEVDAVTGHVWYGEAETDRTVGITSWTTGVQSDDLITTLRNALAQSSYSVLDLNQSTRGFQGTTTSRYALFGGVEKVAFARTSIAREIANPSSPQLAITDFSVDTNFRLTYLPDGAGCCNVLEYSRTSTTANGGDVTRENFGYFFAGTDNGLYAYTLADGEGFNPINLGALNTEPFTKASWIQVPNVNGQVIDIKASAVVDLHTTGTGEALYVIISQSTPTNPFSSKLISVELDSNINDTFSSSKIRTLAHTGVGAFKDVLQFYGMQLIATDNPTSATPEAKEQIILTTNQGLFLSNADQENGQHGIHDAQNQSQASWTVLDKNAVNTTKTTMLNGIGGMDVPIRNTAWPFSIQDQSGFKTFDRGSIHQFSGTGESDGSAVLYAQYFDPNPFNAYSSLPAFKTLDPITYFYTDGGRRFFIFNPTTDPADVTMLSVIPYFVAPWNVVFPNVLTDPILNNERRYYWIRSIGATGIVLAGTEQGVVGLQ